MLSSIRTYLASSSALQGSTGVGLAQKFLLAGLILILTGSTMLSAGWQDRLSELWDRATATPGRQAGTALVITGVAVAVGAAFYKAFTEYHTQQAQLIKAQSDTDLVASVRRGDTQALQALNATSRVDTIKAAVDSGCLAMIKAAVVCYTGQTDLNQRDSAGKTALIYAVINGNSRLIAELLTDGASVTVTDQADFTPLMYLAQVADKFEHADQLASQLIDTLITPAEKLAYINCSALGANALSLALLQYPNHAPILTNAETAEYEAKFTGILSDYMERGASREEISALVRVHVNPGHLTPERSAYLVDLEFKKQNLAKFIAVLIRQGVQPSAKQATHPAVQAVLASLPVVPAPVPVVSAIPAPSSDSAVVSSVVPNQVELHPVSAALAPVGSDPVATAPLTASDPQEQFFELITTANDSKNNHENNLQAVDQLLTSKAVAVDTVDEYGDTGLMLAVQSVNLPLVRCLLKHGANVRAKSATLTPLMQLHLLDPSHALYCEADALEIIKLLNEAELALRAQAGGAETPAGTAAACTPKVEDARFCRLIRNCSRLDPAAQERFITQYLRTKGLQQVRFAAEAKAE